MNAVGLHCKSSAHNLTQPYNAHTLVLAHARYHYIPPPAKLYLAQSQTFAEGSHTMNTPPAGIYVCSSALSGVAFCFFSAKTNKLLMPRAGPVSRYYQWTPLGPACRGTSKRHMWRPYTEIRIPVSRREFPSSERRPLGPLRGIVRL